ncbi:hypothetical protein GGR51DRAFT_356174 [Nemania sp. FL0031]|nr:hypothetical protein GGR51DRAFT_356174 [Nemania sp. FL0031]
MMPFRDFSLKSLGARWQPALRNPEYFSVPDDEKDDLNTLNERGGLPASSRWPRLQSRLSARACVPNIWKILTAVSLITLCVITAMYVRLLRETTPPPRLSCGTTFAEAEARGCTFDQLVKAWLHPTCPRYGLQEYLDAGHTAGNRTGTEQWPYWWDREQTRPISYEDLALMANNDDEGGDKWYTTGREHMTHCTWVLIRLAYVYTTGQRHDFLVSQFHHAKHCALFMLDRALEGPDVDAVRTIGNTVFGSC